MSFNHKDTLCTLFRPPLTLLHGDFRPENLRPPSDVLSVSKPQLLKVLAGCFVALAVINSQHTMLLSGLGLIAPSMLRRSIGGWRGPLQGCVFCARTRFSG